MQMAYMAFPREHGRSLRTNNMLERLFCEVQRHSVWMVRSPMANRRICSFQPGLGFSAKESKR